MVCLNRRGLSSALVVMLLAVVGIVVAIVAIKFFMGAAMKIEANATSQLDKALELLE